MAMQATTLTKKRTAKRGSRNTLLISLRASNLAARSGFEPVQHCDHVAILQPNDDEIARCLQREPVTRSPEQTRAAYIVRNSRRAADGLAAGLARACIRRGGDQRVRHRPKNRTIGLAAHGEM